jgi:hypothetical protein
VGSWKGSARTGIGVERAGRWLLRNRLSGGPAGIELTFGAAAGLPVTGDWAGTGGTSVGMVRDTAFRLRATLAARSPVERRIFVG